MAQKVNVDLGHVQKTLLLPLWGRAVETRKTKPMLVDQSAVEIIDKIDFDFSTITANISPITQAAWIMRSIYTDRVVGEILAKSPNAAFVNIGCGMDTTFDRIDNGRLMWYDLDLPDVIELRRKFIKEGDRRKLISSSFLDEDWLKQIDPGEKSLFIAAGVFYYFAENEIKGFLKKLADRFPGGEVLFDAASPMGVKFANKKVIESAGLDERSYLTWGLKDAGDIVSWDDRYHILKTMYYYKDNRLGFRIRLIGLIADILKIQYMIHLRLGQ